MHARGPDRSRISGGPPAVLLVLALLLIAVVFGAGAGSAAAAAPQVNIVRQGNPPATMPANTHYYKTIQAAVNASTSGDWVLIEPGVYYESVKVTAAQSGIWIRGMDRNEVILDGQNEPGTGSKSTKRTTSGSKTSQCEISTRAARIAATRSGGTEGPTQAKSEPTGGMDAT